MARLKLFRFARPADAQSAPPRPLLARDRLDAKHQEDDVALWRDYHAFLVSRQTLLEMRAAEARGAFERSPAQEAEARQAQARFDALPAGLRAMFEHVLEERRQRVQGELEAELRAQRGSGRARHVDPDEIDRTALIELRGEAEGIGTDTGHFPRGVAGDVRWYAMDVAELLAAPTAASYAVRKGTGDDARRRILQAAAMGAGLLLFLVAWFALPHGPSAPASATLARASVNGASAEVWAVQRAVLNDTRPLTVTATTAAWPTDTDRAAWDSTAVLPLRLCVPPTALTDLTSIRLISGGAWPERVYSIGATRGPATDLVVEACANDRAYPSRYGVLQATAPFPTHAIGAPAPDVRGEPIVLERVRAVGPGQDPALPIGQGRLIVQVRASGGLDWPAYKPTLTLADGQQYLPSETSAITGGAELRYLVPLPAGEIALAWDLTPPGAVQSLRWRATLAPPPSRAQVLRDALRVRAVQLHEDRPGELTLTVAITNQGDEPLILSRDEITLAQGAQPITLPDLPALATPLQPGERRTISFTVALGGLQQPATLTVGGVPFQIAR